MMGNRNILTIIISVVALFVIIFGIVAMITWPTDKDKINEEKELVTSNYSEDYFLTMRNEEPLHGLATPIPMPSPTPSTEVIAQIIGDTGAYSERNKLTNTQKTTNEAPTVSIAETDKVSTTKTTLTVKPTAPVSKPRATAVPVKPSTAIKQESPKKVVEYWIQAGSYTSMSSAEELNSRLAEKGFYGLIKTFEKSGTTFYRVRIGPYREKQEAGKILTWIKDLKDMEGSYISEVYAVR